MGEKIAGSLKFRIFEEEELYMYYLCSENKGADQRCNPVPCAYAPSGIIAPTKIGPLPKLFS